MSPSPQEQGTSILEALIATMLVAVLAAMIFTSFIIGSRAAVFAERMNTALGLAEEGLTSAVVAPCRPPLSPEHAVSKLPPPPARYRREVSAEPPRGSGPWRVTVNVTWTQRPRTHAVTLATYHYISRACEITGQ